MIEDKLPDIYRDLIHKSIAVAAHQEVGDSMIKAVLQKTVTPANILTSKTSFYYNYGSMNDGSKERVNESDMYLLVYSNLILLNNTESAHMDKASTRSSSNLSSVIVYINGLKVPDSKVYIYCGVSGTDIIVPESYFNADEDNTVLIEHRKFLNYSYGGIRVDGFSGSQVTVPVDSIQNLNINKNSCLTYLDGIYIYEKIQTITINANNFVIDFVNPISGDLEVFVDSSAVGHFVNNQVDTNVASFFISDTYLDPLYGPKTKDSCIFMINGKRVGNNDVEMVGRLNYEYNLGETLANIRCELIYTDLGLIKDEGTKIYADDYYLYNMIGSAAVTSGLHNGVSGSIFDGHISFDEVLNKNNVIFDYTLTKTFIDSLDEIQTYENKLLELLETQPYLNRELLKHFGETKRYMNVNWNGTDPKIYLGSVKGYDLGTQITRIVFVNGYYAQSDLIEVNDFDHYWTLNVPSAYFTAGDNMVEIVEYNEPITTKVFKEITTTPVVVETITHYQYESDLFGNIQYVDDIVLLEVVYKEDEPTGIYIEDNIAGWNVVDPSRYTINIIDDIIHVDFGTSDISITTIISSRRIYGKVSLYASGNITYDTMMNELNIGSIDILNPHSGLVESVSVPVVHDGSILAFSDLTGERVFDNTDFLYRSPITHSIIKNSGVMFKRNFPEGTRIDFFMLPIKQELIQYTEDTFANPYGLLYIGNLEYPYSHEYVTITVNDRRLHPDEIDILSDKLIRLHSTETSFQDLYIETSLDVSADDLEVFTSTYVMSAFETYLAGLFSVYDYGLIESGSGDSTEADTAYESFIEGVDSNWIGDYPYTENPEHGEDYTPVRYSPYINAYILWFISNKSDSVWRGHIGMSSELLSQIEIYYDGIEEFDRDIVIHSYERVLFEDVDFTIKNYTGRYNADTKREFLKKAFENELDPLAFYKEYNNHLVSNVLYKEDLRAIRGGDKLNCDYDIVIGRSTKSLTGI